MESPPRPRGRRLSSQRWATTSSGGCNTCVSPCFGSAAKRVSACSQLQRLSAGGLLDRVRVLYFVEADGRFEHKEHVETLLTNVLYDSRDVL